MPFVERFFMQLQPAPNDSESTAKPFSRYYAEPAIVILGDPGSGKTTSFRQNSAEEPNAVVVSIRDFLALRTSQWNGKTLYLDGLDEHRTKTEDGRGVLDRIRGKLDELNRPNFRLSCRAADWHGASETERLSLVSSNGNVLVLRLELLSDADIIAIAGDKLPDPEAFLSRAKQRGIDPLLRNPQTLELIVAEVQDGIWPATRAELYRKACQRLLQETNRQHGQNTQVPTSSLLTAAGYLCCIHLCGGTKGYALSPEDADEAYPDIGEVQGDQDSLVAAVRRRIFREDGQGRVTPAHRTIAEYLSADFLTHRLRDGLPLNRILSLLTGCDGGTLSELRGVYAWLASLCEEEAGTLIHRDPLGLILYGDAAKLSTSGRRMLIENLRYLSSVNPRFRAENWSPEPFGALASPELVPIFSSILSNQTEPPRLIGCILDVIEYGPPLLELREDLMRMVRDDTWPEWARVSAFAALGHICPNDTQMFRALLDDIQDQRVRDEGHRLRGKLLLRLYPVSIGPREIGRYLIQESGHSFNAYTNFISRSLVDLTKPEDLPLLLAAVDAKKIADNSHHFIWEELVGRLMLQILQHLGDDAALPQLYEWLGLGLDKYGRPVANREALVAIQTWLGSHPLIVQGLFLHWLSVTPPEAWPKTHHFWHRLHNIVPPHEFHRWMLSEAEREPDRVRKEFLFREAIQGRTCNGREDSPTLEDLFAYTERNPASLPLLLKELSWDIESWRVEDAQRHRVSKKKEETARTSRIQELSEQLDTIRSGTPTQALIYLAKVYFGLFYDLDRDAQSKERLESATSPEIAAAALAGFVASLRLPDIPTPQMIGQLHTQNQEYTIGFPVLAGLDVVANASFPDVLVLPDSVLKSGLAFHYATITDQERSLGRSLIESRPNICAESLAEYWSPQIRHNVKHISGLYDLAHSEMMKPIAQRVSLPLLKENANAQQDNLELLLHSALRNADTNELTLHLRQILSNPTSLAEENRTLLYAAAYVLDSASFETRLAEHVGGKADQIARVLGFLCPSVGARSETPYPLSIAGLKSVIAISGSVCPPRSFNHSGWVIQRGAEECGDCIRTLIHRLGREPAREAGLALMDLQNDPALRAWRDEISHVQAEQARQRRELAFKYPTVAEVIGTLNQGPPANVADLQAVVASNLHAIREDLRHGPTDGWKGMWNVDHHGKPEKPRPENICRDRLLELLRPRLFRVGVNAEPEGHYAEDKRADIKALIGSINLPVEIKRHFHPDIWTAPCDQLKKLYARDPGTGGRGIYLVFWFGIEVGVVPKRRADSLPIHTLAQFEAVLHETLLPTDKEFLQVIVIDCAPPSKS